MTATALAGAFVRLLFVIGTSIPPSFCSSLSPRLSVIPRCLAYVSAYVCATSSSSFTFISILLYYTPSCPHSYPTSFAI